MSRRIKVFSSVTELRQWRHLLPKTQRVGLVPTMGALHAGHGALLAAVRPRADVSVLSIFVNPTQFGPKEDLDRYPRTINQDLALAADHGVDVVFAPTPETMYPEGYSTFVEETFLSRPLCGSFRPGHFRGVTTVVLKLFNLIEPNLALFGLKDAQQFFVLHKMARDLNLDIAIKGLATIRENDGLAMSSRNAYLTPPERALAPLLYERLKEMASALQRTAEPTLLATLAQNKALLEEAGFRVQYLDCLELPHLAHASWLDATKPYLVAVAAYLGSTRLIDNVIIRPDKLRNHGVFEE